MGCRSSSKVFHSSQITPLQADHDASDDPPSKNEQPSITQAYGALVSTGLELKNELLSELLSSSSVLQDVEERVGNVSGNFRTLSSLASSIVESLERKYPINSHDNLRSDVFKAYAVFVWIAMNIDYNCKAWEDLLNQLPIPSTDPLSVLDTRRTVCSGYAALYTALAAEMGLESAVIDGHFKISRGLQSNGPLDEFCSSHLNTHAWNRVKLGNVWHLLDCTYASGQATVAGFKKHFNRSYFAVPPEQMILTHWPDRVEDQLLETPVPLELIKQLVPLTPDAFIPGISLNEMMECITINDSEPVVDLSLQSAADHDIIAKLTEWVSPKATQPNEDLTRPTSCYIDHQNSQTVRILAVMPSRGIYSLKIFAECANKTTHLVTYTIFCAVDSDRYVGYPRVCGITNRFGFKLHQWNKGTPSHIAECDTGELEIAFEALNKKQIIHFISPGPSEQVNSNSRYHFYSFLSQVDSSNSNIYKLKVLFPTEGLWTVCMDAESPEDAECLMRYEVNVLKKVHGVTYPWIQSPGVAFMNSEPLHATGKEIFDVPFTVDGPLDFYCYLTKNMSSAEKLTQFVACVAGDGSVSHTLRVIFPEPGKWFVQVFGRPRNSAQSSYTNQFCLYLEVDSCLSQLIFPYIDTAVCSKFGIKFLDSSVTVSGDSFDVLFESQSTCFLQPCFKDGWLDNHTFSSTQHCYIYQEKESNRLRLRTTFPSSGRWTVLLFASSLIPGADSEGELKFLYQAKVESIESDAHCAHPVLSPAFFRFKINLPIPNYNPQVDQEIFLYNLSSEQELVFKGVVHRPSSPNNVLHHCVLVIPSSSKQSSADLFHYQLQAVFPEVGDWIIQLFATPVNTGNYQPVFRLRVTSTVPINDRCYPVVEAPCFFSRFQLSMDESMLPLLSKSSTVPTRFSLSIKQPSSVELLHHARDQSGVLHTEATRLVRGEHSRQRILLVELWERGDWTVQLFARMCNEEEWTPVLQHYITILS